MLKPVSEAAVAAFLDGLELFGLGYSWGGYESLAVPFDCTAYRTATRFAPGGPTVRFSVGLEDIEDLKADLDRGFARLQGDGVTRRKTGRRSLNQDCACLCGAIALRRRTGEPIGRFFCHCTICQTVYRKPFADVTYFWARSIALL